MKAHYIVQGFFYTAIAYQLVNISSPISAEPIKNNISTYKSFATSSVEAKAKNIEVKYLKRPKKYRMSKAGLEFIKSHETCVLHAYNDPDPKRRSVGWGHQIQPGEKLEHITKAKADELFEKDIEWVNDAINRLLSQTDKRFVYTQGFIDGLGDMIYNCGERGVTLTEFWNRWSRCRYDKNTPGFINQNDLNFTIAAVKTSRISAKGHIERRYDEHKLMLN
jgi:GH24 family phage-related lysozyme (muramidase)